VPDQLDRLTTALADRYAVEREIGRGGMATVYLAQDLKHGRKVAVKVLRPELGAALGPERFLREIRIAATLNHPHILPLHDSGEADGLLYYVMPYVEGESLGERLNRERQLPVDEALQIAREVADALDYAHAEEIVHRDIKPENVLLIRGHAVVTDFGIGKAVSAAGTEEITQTGVAVGTPAYMSPEQAAGDTELDGRSDLYSLGCTLYEMLTGEPPFTGPTLQAVVAKHFTHTPPDVTATRDSVPKHVSQAISRLLAKTSADRYIGAHLR
jgi:serine/threonine-protein kinase